MDALHTGLGRGSPKLEADLRAALLPEPPAAALPPLNDDVRWILGQPNFNCVTTAQLLRSLGHEIERKAEAEQAAVIHWMLGVYMQHGEKFRDECWNVLKTAACPAVTKSEPQVLSGCAVRAALQQDAVARAEQALGNADLDDGC